MEIIDISIAVSNQLPTWPGDPPFHIERVEKISAGANANVSRVVMGVHTGTHVDAPVHFIDGATGIDLIPLSQLVGPAQVVEFPDTVGVVDAGALKQVGIVAGTERLLLKTRNSRYWAQAADQFHTDFVGVDASGADYLVAQGIRLVGIDYLSIAPYHQSKPTHTILLEAAVVIVEGVDLSRAQPGIYTLYCLPVKLAGSDGAPARAILVKS